MVGALDVLSAPALAHERVGSPRRGRSVAVFGGGIAGLTAAHELAERGFDVTVYERRAWGGKARSTLVPGSASPGRRPLPGEHGYRIEFGFYQNLPDTFRRIPFGSNEAGVFGNLVAVPRFTFLREGRRDLMIPMEPTSPRAYGQQQVVDLLIGLLETEIGPDAAVEFAGRMTVWFSSCDARRTGEWESVTWAEFIGADRYGDDYRKLFGETFSQFFQASKAARTSTGFSAWTLELMLYNLLGRGANGSLDRIFNAPTNDAWFDPWLKHLRALGVRLENHREVVALELDRGRIAQAVLRGPRGYSTVRADWYVCALPVERARRLWSAAVLAADPSLAGMNALSTGWMNGIQFYLRESAPIAEGHVDCVDSPWLVSAINQAQFWGQDFARTYGDGRAHDCLSAICSRWTEPGVLYGKAGRRKIGTG